MFSEWLAGKLDFDNGLSGFRVFEWKFSLKKFGPKSELATTITRSGVPKSFYSSFRTNSGNVTCSFDESERSVAFSPSQCWGRPTVSLALLPKNTWLLEESINVNHRNLTCTLRSAQTKRSVSFWANTEQTLSGRGWNCGLNCLIGPELAGSIRVAGPGITLTTSAKRDSVLLRAAANPSFPVNIETFGEVEVEQWEVTKCGAGLTAGVEYITCGAIFDFINRYHQEKLFIEAGFFNVSLSARRTNRFFLEYGIEADLPDFKASVHINTDHVIGFQSSVIVDDRITVSAGCETKSLREIPTCQFSVLLTE